MTSGAFGQTVVGQANRYAAFISYRQREPDATWAHWLQETLEIFETPPELVRKGYPRSLGRVFVDDTEMSASVELSTDLKAALWDSQYLIVVCSPETPYSKWVRAEISLFQHLGRADRILSLLVEGDPQRAYPPELLKWRLVGDGPSAAMELIEPNGASVLEVQTRIEAELKALARDRFASALLVATFRSCGIGKKSGSGVRRQCATSTASSAVGACRKG